MHPATEISMAELEIMRIIWAQSPVSSREIIDIASQVKDWKEGTIKSLIHRLLQKEFIEQDTSQRPYLISAKISAEEATWSRIDEEYEQVCACDRQGLLLHLLKQTELSKVHCQELIRFLEAKATKAPESIRCQCPPGQCRCHHAHAH
ncbi:Predicted transcriptional regulator [Ignavigranum ruoffiae]|uniref:Predicted transcriptional regulator n=2 Tax=Ignavigranum ruoffiae TaxID=89093 RepID=A0A1H9D2B2_9LACT|nr:Predicted transcriptional regulator [Ignavigranum ruoffiae]